MREARWLPAEEPRQQRLAGRRRGEIAAPHHLGDPHRQIVGHDRELVGEHPVPAPQHEVPGHRRYVLADRAEHRVVDLDHGALAVRHREADGGRATKRARAHPLGPARARVARPLFTRVRRAGDARDLGPGAVAVVRQPPLREEVDRGGVERCPLGLHVRRRVAAHVRPLVPAHAEPAQVVEDGGVLARDHPAPIDVLHAKHEPPSRSPRRRRAEQRRRGAAEVQITGGRRREAAPVEHGGGSIPGAGGDQAAAAVTGWKMRFHTG